MLNIGNSQCINKIGNCSIPFKFQPSYLNIVGSKYSCPQCLPGFYTNENGGCTPCSSISSACTECDSKTVKVGSSLMFKPVCTLCNSQNMLDSYGCTEKSLVHYC